MTDDQLRMMSQAAQRALAEHLSRLEPGAVPDDASGMGGSSPTSTVPIPADPPLGLPGLPIPDRYGYDRLVLLIQDACHIFAYWELTASSLTRARRELGQDGAPVLLLHSSTGCEQREIDLDGGHRYLAVTPQVRYVGELALRADDGRLAGMVRSNTLCMPRLQPCDHQDQEWMVADETFHDLMLRSGLPGTGGSSTQEFRHRMAEATWARALTTTAPSSLSLLSSYHLDRVFPDR